MTAADAAVCQCGHPQIIHDESGCWPPNGCICEAFTPTCVCGHDHDYNPDDKVPHLTGCASCPCTAFVVNRPDDDHWQEWRESLNPAWSAMMRDPESLVRAAYLAGAERERAYAAAVPDREARDELHTLLAAETSGGAAIEQLAALLATHRIEWDQGTGYDGCTCSWRAKYPPVVSSDDYEAHVAAVIVAAGWINIRPSEPPQNLRPETD